MRSFSKRNLSGSGEPATYGDMGGYQYSQMEVPRRAVKPGRKRPSQAEEYSPLRPEEGFNVDIQAEYGPKWGLGKGPDLDTTDSGEYYVDPEGSGYGGIKGYTSRKYERGYGTVPQGDRGYSYGLSGFGNRYQPFIRWQRVRTPG